MCCSYLLMNKAGSVNDLAEYSHVGNLDRDIDEQAELGRCYAAAEGERCQPDILSNKPQTHGDTQINRDGLI